MRASALFAAAACAATASAQLRLPFNARSPIDGSSSSNSDTRRSSGERRSLSGIDVFGYPRYIGYFVNVTVGTPPQDTAMLVTVQSGESWVPDGEDCPRPLKDSWCGVFGAFAANESSTYVNSGVEELTQVQPGGTLRGEVIDETLRIGGIELANINLGLVYASRDSIGVLGLGFNDSSAYRPSSSSGPGSSLPTVSERLLRDGHIKSTAYSLWVDDVSGASGSLLLGAVDKSKFDAPLTRFPIKTSSPSKTRFDTVLHSVNASKSPADAFQPFLDPSDGEITVEISLEQYATLLPYKLAADIYELVGAVWSDYHEYWLVPCSANTSEARLAIGLHGADGPALDVNLADLVVSWESWSTKMLSWDLLAETDHCLFGVQSANSSGTAEEDPLYQTFSIGTAALRRAYMVFDLAGEEIAIAKARFGSTAKEDVVAFASYGAAIPESTSAGASCSPGSSSSSCNSGGDSSGDGTTDVGSSASPRKSVPLISVIGGSLGLILFGLAM